MSQKTTGRPTEVQSPARDAALERMARALGVVHLGVNTDGGKCGLCRARAAAILDALLGGQQ